MLYSNPPQCQLNTTVKSRHTDWKVETIAEHTLHMTTNNSQTGGPNDKRLLMLISYISKPFKTDFKSESQITLNRLI